MAQPILGINNCFAVKRWAGPEQWLRIVREELELNTVQFSLDLLPPAVDFSAALEHATRVRKLAEDFEVDINSVFTGLAAYSSNLLLSDSPTDRAASEGWFRGAIDVAAEMGAKGMGGHLGAYSVPTSRDAKARSVLTAEFHETLLRLGRYAHAAGLEFLLVENLAVPREPVYTISDAHRLEAVLADSQVPWRLCLDLGHAAVFPATLPDGDPAAWLRETWQHTPILQIQQSARGADQHAPFTFATNADGVVQRRPVLTAVEDWVVDEAHLFLEVIPAHEANDDEVLEGLRESVAYWCG